MSIYYPSGCVTEDAAYVASCCPVKEGARVRHVFLQLNTYTFADYEDQTEWETAVANGDVIIIPNVRGSYDGGTVTTTEGFGDTPTEFESFEGTVSYTDANYLTNVPNYNAMMKSKTYIFGFCTETMLFVTDVAASYTPKMPVALDIKQSVYGEIEVKFVQSDLLIPYTYPQGIFTCFQVL
jgi:hypothetical protein